MIFSFKQTKMSRRCHSEEEDWSERRQYLEENFPENFDDRYCSWHGRLDCSCLDSDDDFEEQPNGGSDDELDEEQEHDAIHEQNEQLLAESEEREKHPFQLSEKGKTWDKCVECGVNCHFKYFCNDTGKLDKTVSTIEQKCYWCNSHVANLCPTHFNNSCPSCDNNSSK